MTVLLQISDTHFGTEQPPVVAALLALAAQQRPDLVVLSGDVTQRARPAQFRAAHGFVRQLGIPLVAVPGNHDIPLYDLFTRLVRPYARFRSVFGNDIEPVHGAGDLLVVCVKTTRRYRHVNGEVSSEQVERVAARLAKATARQLRIVVVHQPVAVLRESDAHDLLRGCGAALKAWSAAGCDLVLGGHIHLPYVIELHQPTGSIWAVQAGTALSSRVRGGIGNSINILRWNGAAAERCCAVERWDFTPDRQTFMHVMTTEARLGALAAPTFEGQGSASAT
ncbi:MAG: metallophosphoesterase [Burkholderiales bacterium]